MPMNTKEAIDFIQSKRVGKHYVVSTVEERKTLKLALQRAFELNWEAYMHRIKLG